MNADQHLETVRRLLLLETGSQSVTLAIPTRLSKAGYEICRESVTSVTSGYQCLTDISMEIHYER